MDHPDSPGGSRPPRKELQGPRPTPLKVRKESHKIKKPPVAPPANPPHQHQQVPSQPPPPPRQPVIIYTVSPKVIHTHPSEFMTLVQRLTGPDATSSSSSSTQYPSSNFTTTTSSSSSNMVTGFSSTTTSHHHVITGGVSPAARFASIERTKMHPEAKRMVGQSDVIREQGITFGVGGDGGGGGGGDMEGVERTVFFPGILSPGPSSLPPISPNLFSPFFHDPNNLNLQQHHHDLSVVQHGNKSFIEGSYLPSPFSTNFTSPSTIFSPNSLDFLQRVLDN